MIYKSKLINKLRMDCIYLEIFKDYNFEKEDEGE